MSARRGIVVVGSSNVDFIMQLPKLPAVGETVMQGEFQQVYGGKGANQAVAAARSGGLVTFIAAVGDDHFGTAMIDNFERDGIDTGAIIRSAGIATGSALIMVDAQGRNMISVAPGANSTLLPEHIEAQRHRIAHASVVVLQMEVPAETVLHTLEIARQQQTPVILNYAPAHHAPVPVTDAIHTLIVNEVEAQQLSGIAISAPASCRQAAQALLAQGPQNVIITLGKDGTFIASGQETHYVPAYRVNAVDTTAAGDVFCGALSTAIVEGRSLPDAARFATAASAISVTRQGAQPSVPTRAEIEAFLAENQPVTSVGWG